MRTRLHVTSAGGKRTKSRKKSSSSQPFSCVFLSGLSGKHDSVFAMNFSSVLDDDRRYLARPPVYFVENTQVRSGDAGGPEARAARLPSHSFNACNRTNNRRDTHRKVIFRFKSSLPPSSHLCPSHLRSLREDVAEQIKSWKSRYPRFQPQLAIIQAGSRPDSTVYVRMKAKAAEEVGISLNHITLPEKTTVEEVVSVVKKLNDDSSVSGVLVQLPLGPHVDPNGERTVTEAISPEKDVDGSVVALSCGRPLCLTSTPPKFPCIQHWTPLIARF
jgi:hypothetical protein